jgi:threonine/homoserine/homoserine lactone efflux protein
MLAKDARRRVRPAYPQGDACRHNAVSAPKGVGAPTGDRIMSIEFLITSLIVVASPGTGVVYTVAAGLTRGTRGSIIAALGCTIGIVPHMVAALTGIAALLHTSALAFQALKYLGVAYLLYLAWHSLKADGALKVESDMAPRSAWRVIMSAVLVNLLNPKLSLFFLAFLPQFVGSREASPLARMLEMSAVFMAMTFVVFTLYGACAARVKDHIISRPAVLAWMRRGFAAGFVALAAKLAVTRQ